MRWRPFAVTLFDCDSTLAAIEGIDELTDDPDRQSQIASLTESAMDGHVPLEEVYGRRLSLVNPTRNEIRGVKQRYKSTAVPDAQAVIAALAEAGNETWIISGGLREPVVEFATWLGVDPERVRAVETEFDPLAGQWWDGQADARYADHHKSPLTTTDGKADIIRSAVTSPGRRLFIGDGVSDLAATEEVDLFAAYAGVVERDAVTNVAPVVIESESISPVLALALGLERVRELTETKHADVADTCLETIAQGGLRFNDDRLAGRFGSV